MYGSNTLGWTWGDVWEGITSTGKKALDIYTGYGAQKETQQALALQAQQAQQTRETITNIAKYAAIGLGIWGALKLVKG